MKFCISVLTTVESIGLRFPKQSEEYNKELEFALRQIDFKVAITTMVSQIVFLHAVLTVNDCQLSLQNSLVETKTGKATSEKEREFVQYRRADYLSHFILRLAYCST